MYSGFHKLAFIAKCFTVPVTTSLRLSKYNSILFLMMVTIFSSIPCTDRESSDCMVMDILQRHSLGKTHDMLCVGRFFKRWLSEPYLPLRHLPPNYNTNKSTSCTECQDLVTEDESGLCFLLRGGMK